MSLRLMRWGATAATDSFHSFIMNTKNKKTSTPGRKQLVSFRSRDALDALDHLREVHSELIPHMGKGWNKHIMVTQDVTAVARLLYLSQIYEQIINVPGVVCEFGVQWGATLCQLINLRAVYEPFNHSRIVYGFDTFNGFPSVHQKDGRRWKKGDLATIKNYEVRLDKILSLIEKVSPMAHIKKFRLVKGDVIETIDTWLETNPHAIIALAVFDMDLYEPTKEVLIKIKNRLTKGSIIAFDELNCQAFPGETVAVAEALGLNTLRLRRSPLHPFGAWAVFGD